MKLVKFGRHFNGYNPGDVAGFEDAQAAELIKYGTAAPLVKDVPTVAKDTPAVVQAVPAASDAEHSSERHGRRRF
jgi:hypothetical protein